MQRKHRLCSRLSTFLNLDFHLTTFEMVNILVRDIDRMKFYSIDDRYNIIFNNFIDILFVCVQN